MCAQWRPADYWNSLDDDDDLDLEAVDDDDRETVLEVLEDRLDDVIEMHGVMVTRQQGDTVYLLVSYSRTNSGGEAVDIQTVCVDLGDESLRFVDNSLWVPRDPGVLAVLSRAINQARDDLAGRSDTALATGSADEMDPDRLLAHPLRGDDYDPDDSSGNVPPELHGLVDRLAEAGLETDRFNRLRFGRKDPFDHEMRPKGDIFANYGCYATSEDRLVIVDVDDPDETPDLPATYTVTSPHGGPDRCHRYYAVDDIEAWRERFGKFNLELSFGEVQVHNHYVVGPGSQLDPEGCDTGDYSKGDPDACPECSDPDGGNYEVLIDRPIREIPVDEFAEILEIDSTADDGARDGDDGARVDSDPDRREGAAESTETVTCYQCSRILPKDGASMIASDGDREVWVCSRGCSG